MHSLNTTTVQQFSLHIKLKRMKILLHTSCIHLFIGDNFMNMKVKGITSLILISSALFMPMSNVLAVPTHASFTTYYSDASKTTPVGSRVLLCNGSRSMVGSETPFVEVETIECPCSFPQKNRDNC